MENIWISASAGTGKTKTLVDRVLSLLLSGNTNILCLTFTKAAANEMLERIYRKLGAWMLLSDEDVYKEISAYNHHNILSYVRSLFDKLSKILTIQTIHAFCYDLIRKFPAEAGIPVDTKILEYKDEVYNHVVHEFIRSKPDLGSIASEMSIAKLYSLFEELAPNIANYEKYHQYLQQLKQKINFPAQYDFSEIIAVLRKGSRRDNKHAELLSNNDPHKVFISTNDSKKKISSIITKQLLEKNPCIEENIINAVEQYYQTWQQQNKFKVIERTQLILKIVDQMFRIYKRLTPEHISYNEIIKTTIELLHNDAVMLHLNNTIDHLLIDEAQDNSRDQWEIIRLLSEDFFSGVGMNNNKRTLFIVGDNKQSIYGFQGAEPKFFQLMYQYFANQASYFQQEISYITLDTSYRSTISILNLVDNIFNKFTQELLSDQIIHKCFRKDLRGHVELWPLISSQKDEMMPWIPGYNYDENDIKKRLAQKIAITISKWIMEKRLINEREISVSDIIILVRRRSIFIYYLIKELQQKNIPVAGYDRFIITDHILIKDLIAFGMVLLNPMDDLQLINTLKSFLFNFTEEKIFQLCYNRKDLSVWQRLEQLSPNTYKKIEEWRNMCCTSFELYLLVIKKKLSLFQEHDIINKFLDFAFEKPILSDFINFIQHNKIEVNNSNAPGIKIMTVHNAKGLEAPIVFLADTTDVPCSKDYITYNEDMVPLYLKQDSFELMKDNENKKRYSEYIRLLYVALTRAKDELYITGWGKAKEKSWYCIVQQHFL